MIDLLRLAKGIHYVDNFWVFLAPLFLMLIDIITGFTKAWVTKTVKSSKMRDGIAKKIGEFLLIVAMAVVVYAVMLPKEITYGTSVYILFMEGVSILENIDLMGVNIPLPIKKKINNFHSSLTSGDEEQIQKSIEELQKMLDEAKKLKGDENNGK